ncbi:MAG: hypothetical protein ACKVWV_11370 [Planctomycetota bacterium]
MARNRKTALVPREVVPHVLQAAKQWAMRRTAGLVAPKVNEQFSGTFVRFGDTPFIATAQHCLANVHDIDDVMAFSYERPLATTPLKWRAKIVDRHFDTALLELDPDSALALDPEWITLETVNSEATGPGSTVCFVGFPSAPPLTHELPGTAGGLALTPIAYGTNVTIRDIPPLRSDNRQPDEDVDLFLEYDTENTVDNGTGHQIVAPLPFGLSGAGVFSISVSAEPQLWSPSQCRLVGTVSSYLGSARLIRATRSESLRVLYDRYLARN